MKLYQLIRHIVRFTLLGLILGSWMACVPRSGRDGARGLHGDAGPQGANGATGPQSSRDAAMETGSSSGGGGFVEENSAIILHTAAEGLAKLIRLSSPSIYARLPQGWTQEKLASLIEKVRYEPTKDRSREGKLLMFDYGADASGPYILALKPFFVAYASVPVKYGTYLSLGELYKDVRLKLVHEAAHHLGLEENEAEEFGRFLLTALEVDNIHCEGDDTANWADSPESVLPIPRQLRLHFVLNRPSGLGFHSAYRARETSEDGNNITPESELIANQALRDLDRLKLDLQNWWSRFISSSKELQGQLHSDLYQIEEQSIRNRNGSMNFDSYDWQPGEAGSDNRSVFTARNPVNVIETLTVSSQDKGGIYDATLEFQSKSRGAKQKLQLSCKFVAPTVFLPGTPNASQENAKLTLMAKSGVYLNLDVHAPGERRLKGIVEIGAVDNVLEQPIRQALGAHVAKYLPLQKTLSSEKVSSCEQSGRFYDRVGVVKAFQMQDGRLCAIGLQLAAWVDSTDRVSFYGAVLDSSSLSPYRNYQEHAPVICFKGDKEVLADDIAKKLLSPDIEIYWGKDPEAICR